MGINYTYNQVRNQFTDPVTGYTVYDDGTPTYYCQSNGKTYTKNYIMNGESPANQSGNIQGSTSISYMITLTPED